MTQREPRKQTAGVAGGTFAHPLDVCHQPGNDGPANATELRAHVAGQRVVRVDDLVQVHQQLGVEVIDVKSNGNFVLASVASGRPGAV